MPALDNELHERFCEEYLVDLNATKAYMRVNHDVTYDSAKNYGNRLLQNVTIRSRVREMMDERSKDTLVDARFVVEGLNELYQRCLQAKPVEVWDFEEKAMVQTGEWQFDSHGAAKALELLGKHVAMFTEKSEVKTDTSIPPEAIQSIADKINSNANTR